MWESHGQSRPSHGTVGGLWDEMASWDMGVEWEDVWDSKESSSAGQYNPKKNPWDIEGVWDRWDHWWQTWIWLEHQASSTVLGDGDCYLKLCRNSKVASQAVWWLAVSIQWSRSNFNASYLMQLSSWLSKTIATSDQSQLSRVVKCSTYITGMCLWTA